MEQTADRKLCLAFAKRQEGFIGLPQSQEWSEILSNPNESKNPLARFRMVQDEKP